MNTQNDNKKKSNLALFSVMQRAFYIVALMFGVAIILSAVALGLGVLYAFGVVGLEAIQTTTIKDWLIVGGIMVMIMIGIALINHSPKIVRWAWYRLKHGA